jgi:hypothetical protein
LRYALRAVPSREETLKEPAFGAITNPIADEALVMLPKLRCSEMHLTHLPTSGDGSGLRQLGSNQTSKPNSASKIPSEKPSPYPDSLRTWRNRSRPFMRHLIHHRYWRPKDSIRQFIYHCVHKTQ